MCDLSASPSAATAGSRWVESYLLPLIHHRLSPPATGPLVCLQIEPDDEEEALRLRQEGYVCDTVACERRGTATPWRQPPRADPARLPLASDRYDVVFTGAFGRLTTTRERRRAVARELARICKHGGAVLLTVGNRLCPLDLSGNAPRLHGPWHPALTTLAELEQVFVDECGFTRLLPLSLTGHFGWTSVSGANRIVIGPLAAYLRWSSRPERRGVYASPLNPMLSVWIEH